MTTVSHDDSDSLTNLIALLDQFPEGCDPDFDNETEELERQFAELRLTFDNNGCTYLSGGDHAEQFKTRIKRCAKAIGGYAGDCDPVANLVDLLADAMHLCHTKRLDFERLLATATMHFEVECSDNTDTPTRFDGYEIHGVREFGKGKNRHCEQVPDDDAKFWSLYGHIPGQGLDCIGDFKTRDHAEEVYARITGQCYGEPLRKEARHA